MVPLLWIYIPGYYVALWVTEHIIIHVVAFDPILSLIALCGAAGLFFVMAKK